MPEGDYSVYLVQRHGDQGGKREVTSPVTGHRLEFYDTGVWLDREAGRNFFPYEQIRTIREHPEGQRPADESSESEATDSGETDSEDTDEETDGEEAGDASDDQTPERSESGAEEEMLE